MVVPLGALDSEVTDGVLGVQMVIDEPMLLFDGTLNEKAAVLPLFSVYQLPLLYDTDLLVTPLRLLPFSRPPMAAMLPPVM